MKISQLFWCLGFLVNSAAVAQDLAVLPPDQEDPSVMMDHPPEGQFTVIGPVVRGFAWDKDAPNAKVSVKLSIIPDPGGRMARAAADADKPLKTLETIANVEGAYSSGVSGGGHDFVFRLHEELAGLDPDRLKNVRLRLEVANVSPHGAPGDWVSAAFKTANLAVCMRPPADATVSARKVLLIEIDPVCKTRGNQRFSQLLAARNRRAGDPTELARRLVDVFREDSGGRMEFQLLPTEYDENEWPVMRWKVEEGDPDWAPGGGKPANAPADPYEYGEAYAVADVEADRQPRWFRKEKDLVECAADYNKFATRHRLEERHAAGEFDEVWIYGFWACGFYESTLGGGARPFWCNSQPMGQAATSERPFDSPRGCMIMGFNWERGIGEALEAFGHRAESTFKYVWGEGTSPWARFAAFEKNAPGKAGVGVMHYGPQTLADYEWDEPRFVQSACDDWLLWPNLRGETSVVNHREYVDAYPGVATIEAHHRWWFAHLPRAAGSTDGRFNNWWRYFADPDLVMQEPGR